MAEKEATILLDENVTREAMHLADKFDWLHELADKRGCGAEKIVSHCVV